VPRDPGHLIAKQDSGNNRLDRLEEAADARGRLLKLRLFEDWS
jgi:hypothetical protein